MFAEHLSQTYERQALLARLHSLQPNVTCLLSDPAVLLDRWLYESRARDDTLPPAVSLEAALVADALHLQPRTVSHRHLSPTLCDFSTVCWCITLPNLHQHVQQLSYYTPLSTIKDAMEYLLSKVINQRCQGRKYATVLLRYLKSPTQGLVLFTQLRALILCSLLGNYTHVPASSRPTGPVRVRLYEIFRAKSTESMKAWIMTLVEHGSILIEYCLRDYLIYAILDNPPLHHRLFALMNFDRFQQTVTTGLNKVRQYFNSQLCVPVSALYLSLVKIETTPLPWHHDIENLLHATHASMLQISYRRPNPGICQAFICARRKIRLVRLPTATMSVEEEIDEEEKEELCPLPGVSLAEDIKRTPSLSLLPYISIVQYEALRQMVVTYGPERPGLMQALLPYLVDFGVTTAVIAVIQAVLFYHEHSNTTSFRQPLTLLAAKQPHAYNLLQAVAEVQHELRRLRHMCSLPAMYLWNQIKAQQERFHLPFDRLLVEQSDLVYCDPCGAVLSLLRDFALPWKEAYKYGLRDAEVDYTTNEVYCSNSPKKKVTNHRGCCGVQPLTRVSLLGEVYRYQGKTILLCPQYQCGMPFVLDTRRCMHNERGWGCCECTLKTKYDAQLVANIQKTCLKTHVKCVLCNTVLSKAESVHLYPCQTFLCRTHHNQLTGLSVYLTTHLASNTTLLAFAKKEYLCIVCWLDTQGCYIPGMKRMLCVAHQTLSGEQLRMLFLGPIWTTARVSAGMIVYRRARKQEAKARHDLYAKRNLASYKYSNRMKR